MVVLFSFFCHQYLSSFTEYLLDLVVVVVDLVVVDVVVEEVVDAVVGAAVLAGT